ncbi:BolA family protein [Marinomonas epiphytica]
MIIQNKIEASLQANFQVQHMILTNESHMHNVPPGSESHFKLVLVTDEFDALRKVQRHQKVYGALKEEMTLIHALAMHLYTVAEWQDNQFMAPNSPKCHGGE